MMDMIYLVILAAVVFYLMKLRRGGRRTVVTYRDRKGYERFADSGRSVHRWAAAKKLGRALRPNEVVHHENRDKSDNRPWNLWVFRNQKAHDRAHKIDAYRHGKKASYKGFEE